MDCLIRTPRREPFRLSRRRALRRRTCRYPDIAAEVGTPFYCYSTATLTRHYQRLRRCLRRYRRDGLLRDEGQFQPGGAEDAGELGSGADVVSEGELRRALAVGIPAEKILFSGVGKTAREMDFALAAGIHCFNVESEPELELLVARAVAAGKVAPVSLRINPDVDAKTHHKISTGKKEDKFGISWLRAREVYRRAAELPACGLPASTCISAARSPSCSPSTMRSSC
jgi:diaminopimelate decarboxylase